jgi:acyl carrier protein
MDKTLEESADTNDVETKPSAAPVDLADPETAAAFEKFRTCAVDVLGVPAEQVTLEATFEDLEADSLDLVELVMALEEAFDVTVDEAELEGIETVGQAYELISAKL